MTTAPTVDTDALYARLRHLIPPVEWALHAPLIERIHELKRARNAVILSGSVEEIGPAQAYRGQVPFGF